MSREVRSLTEALYKTLHNSSKSMEQLAEEIGISTSYLYRTGLPDTEINGPEASGVPFQLKKLVPLIRATGDYQVLDFIERSLGRVAINIPEPSACAVETLQENAINSAAEFGDLMQQVRESLRDSQLTAAEKAQIHREGWEAIQAIAQLIKVCCD